MVFHWFYWPRYPARPDVIRKFCGINYVDVTGPTSRMLANLLNSSLYPEWLEYVQVPEVKDAFIMLLGSAATLKELTCHAQFKGKVRDFRFITSNDEQPYSFIVNSKWLLFYFRAPSVRNGAYSLESLRVQFPNAIENRRGEWTVRLHTVQDVKRLLAYLKLQ